MSPRQGATDGRILALLIPLLAFVLGTPRLTGRAEPYPALMMPGFQSAGGPFRDVTILRRAHVSVRFMDGATESIPIADLFAPLPSSHHGILLHAFEPHATPAESVVVPTGARTRGGQLRNARAARRGRIAEGAEMRAWFRTRIQASTGRADAESFTVWWTSELRDRRTAARQAELHLGAETFRVAP